MNLADVIKKIKPSLPMIFLADANNNILGTGSGFVFQESDVIVTCAHVVSGENVNIVVKFPDDDTMISAKTVLIDNEHDIALLKYSSSTIRPPLPAYGGEISEGMPIIFSGYPLSMNSLTTHQGIISSIIIDPTGMTRFLIDGTVNPGNSGGALMTTSGEVIGIIDATRRENANILGMVQNMPTGALSIHGIDIVGIYKSVINNLQLGIGYAIPSSYIPQRTSAPIAADQITTNDSDEAKPQGQERAKRKKQ